MATNKRTYPNSNFVWYNDDNRLAILAEDNSSTGSERTTEKYDTFQGTGNLSGTITGVSRVDAVATYTTSSAHGLATGDRVSISGTTNFNDAALSSKDTFRFTDASAPGAGETGTWSTTNVLSGIRITYHAKYEEALLTTNNLQSYCGLDSALHSAVVCYIKARLYEDDEDMELAMYYRKMYEQKVKKFRGRRSAVRHLAVSRL